MLLCVHAAYMSEHVVSCISDVSCCYIAGDVEPHVDSVKHSDWTSIFHARRPDHDWVFAKHGKAPFHRIQLTPYHWVGHWLLLTHNPSLTVWLLIPSVHVSKCYDPSSYKAPTLYD